MCALEGSELGESGLGMRELVVHGVEVFELEPAGCWDEAVPGWVQREAAAQFYEERPEAELQDEQGQEQAWTLLVEA